MRLCITGGGTGGHLMVAQALLQASYNHNNQIIFIGSRSGQDTKYFQDEEQFDKRFFLDTTGVVNQKGLKKIVALYKVFQAFLDARKILKQNAIEAVYSVGGFSSAPASFAALSLKIPLFIHEQNAVAGRLNELLRPYATSFISAYEKNSTIQGYPVKESFFQTARVRTEIKTVIFLGGSHGAKAINDLALSVAKDLNAKGIKIIHQAGDFDLQRVQKVYQELNIEVSLYGFTKKLDTLIAQADLAISRAGASTLWELTSNGCPAFYIPYPYAALDHQYFNAQFIVENEMGWCQRENVLEKEKLLEILDQDVTQKSKKLLDYATHDVAKQMIESLQRKIDA